MSCAGLFLTPEPRQSAVQGERSVVRQLTFSLEWEDACFSVRPCWMRLVVNEEYQYGDLSSEQFAPRELRYR